MEPDGGSRGDLMGPDGTGPLLGGTGPRFQMEPALEPDQGEPDGTSQGPWNLLVPGGTNLGSRWDRPRGQVEPDGTSQGPWNLLVPGGTNLGSRWNRPRFQMEPDHGSRWNLTGFQIVVGPLRSSESFCNLPIQEFTKPDRAQIARAITWGP